MSAMSKSTTSSRDTLAPKLREKSNKLKQLDLFYKDPLDDGHGGKAEERPEDCVPDLPENQEVRNWRIFVAPFSFGLVTVVSLNHLEIFHMVCE